MNISLNNYNNQRKELNTKFEDSKNFSIKLQKDKDEQLIKIKELLKMYSYYSLSNEEKKNDYYITDRKNYIMEKLIKLYEKNKLSSHNLINNLQNYFKNHTLQDYFNNISNIVTASTIIKNELDIDFIYNRILKNFYSNDNNSNSKYILGSPCFKGIIDTHEPFIFHKNCDNVGDTIMFIKTNKTRFGGITDLSWGGKYYNINKYKKTKTRLFNLDNQKIFKYDNNSVFSKHLPPIRGDNYYLATFGANDIYLGYLPWESSSDFPQQFLKSNDTDKRFNDLLNQNISPFYDDIKFEYEDIEVYPIILINNTEKI